MKILRLLAQNVKRLSAVEITPAGNVVLVGGKNSQGKSSVLDSIEMALRGGHSIPPKPIREGADRATSFLDLGDYTVERVFTAAGSRLVVRGKDGKAQTSPQELLNGLIGGVSFDPLEFSRLKPSDQASKLAELLGLNFEPIDAERKRLFDERTMVWRERRDKQGELESTPADPQAPTAEVKISDLTAEHARRVAQNTTNDAERRKIDGQVASIEKLLDADHGEANSLRAQIAALQAILKVVEERIDAHDEECAGLIERRNAMLDEDVAAAQRAIADAESANDRWRKNQKSNELRNRCAMLTVQHDELSEKIKGLDEQKQRMAAAAKFPIAGLGFDDEGVTFNGVPFAQASSAQKLQVSVAIGLAMNPKLKVLLIREGSLLDADHLDLIARMASAADAQVWIEVVRDSADVQVVIEDGHVRVAAGVEELEEPAY